MSAPDLHLPRSTPPRSTLPRSTSVQIYPAQIYPAQIHLCPDLLSTLPRSTSVRIYPAQTCLCLVYLPVLRRALSRRSHVTTGPSPGIDHLLTQVDVGVKDALCLAAVVVQGEVDPLAAAEDGAELKPVHG